MAVSTALEYARDAEWAPWDQYTVSWTAVSVNPAIGNGSIVGKFRRVGTTGYLRGAISVGTTTTFGTGGWRVSMPTGWVASNTPASDGYQVGGVVMVPAAGSAYNGFCWAQPNTSYLQLVTDATPAAFVATGAPVAWTQNAANFLSWNIVVELAS